MYFLCFVLFVEKGVSYYIYTSSILEVGLCYTGAI